MRSPVVIAVLCTVLGTGVFSQQASVVAITGGTLIDGNGGAPISDAIVVVSGDRIAAAGPRATTTVPAGATIIDARGKFLMPGLVDTNVHLSLYGGTLMADESYATRRGRPAGRATIGVGPGRGSAW